jgi:hypothetical protein
MYSGSFQPINPMDEGLECRGLSEIRRDEIMDWRSQLEMFMPHGMCLLWRPGLMSLHIVSDALIALAYFTIPISILRFVRGRDDLKRGHLALALLFAAFIAFCGLTHLRHRGLAEGRDGDPFSGDGGLACRARPAGDQAALGQGDAA